METWDNSHWAPAQGTAQLGLGSDLACLPALSFAGVVTLCKDVVIHPTERSVKQDFARVCQSLPEFAGSAFSRRCWCPVHTDKIAPHRLPNTPPELTDYCDSSNWIRRPLT